jgi:hypothetical protein
MKLLRKLLGLGAGVTIASTLGALGAPIGALRASATAGLGCQTHACDASFVCIDTSGLMKFVSQASDCTPSTLGDMPIPGYNTTVDVSGSTRTWTSSSTNGPWLNFPGNRTYIINLPAPIAGHSFLAPPAVWVSADNPGDASAHGNFISGPGYLAEQTGDGCYQQVTVFNGSCALYSLLIEVQADVTADAGTYCMDAGSGADAASGSDAENDVDAGSGPDAPDASDAGSAE